MGVANVGHSVHVGRGLVSLYTALVPNFHFIQHNGYSDLTKYAATLPPPVSNSGGLVYFGQDRQQGPPVEVEGNIRVT